MRDIFNTGKKILPLAQSSPQKPSVQDLHAPKPWSQVSPSQLAEQTINIKFYYYYYLLQHRKVTNFK